MVTIKKNIDLPANKLFKFVEQNYKKIILILFIIYTIFIVHMFFSVQCLNKPVINDDYAIHYAELISSYQFFNLNGHIWGYSPFYFAGYPSGIYQAIDNHWALLFQIVFGKLFNFILVFNFSLLIGYILLPLFAWLGGRNFGLGKINAVFFLLTTLFFIGGFNEVRKFFMWGLYGFLIAIFLSFYVSSLFFKYLTRKKNIDLFKLTLFGSLALWIHPLSAVICMVICAPLWLLYFKNLSLKDYMKLISSLVIIIIINLSWIVPFFKFLNYFRGFGNYLHSNPSFLFTDYLHKGQYYFIMALFLFFICRSIKNKNYRLPAALFMSSTIFFILSFFGTPLGFQSIEPMRFIVITFFLFLFSALTLFETELKRRNWIYFIILFLIIILMIQPPIQLRCGSFSSDGDKVIEYLKMNVPANARIQIQETSVGSHFSALVPFEIQRESMAGPEIPPAENYTFTQFKFAGDFIFGKNLSIIKDKELENYLGLYNIKYFIVSNNKTFEEFNKRSFLKEVFHVSNFHIYLYLNSSDNFCFNCTAVVIADYNHIKVTDAKSIITILKYHYIETLKIKPDNIKIEPIYLLGDPSPFILVRNGNNSNFTVYN